MNELNDILDSIDMEFLLQREGYTYKESYGRSGRQLNMRVCPFCHKSEWRVYVNAENGVGNCFSGSCPKGRWSKWGLMQGIFETSGRNLVTLLKDVAREQGWRPTAPPSLGIQDINTLDLPDSTPAWEMEAYPEYLARRGVFADMAEYFRLHWCENATWNYMDPRGYECKQDYSGRVLMPILDLDGELVSFQGRDVTGESDRRYLFPPGFASAGSYLYNALNVTADTNTLVIAEGVFDVIQTKRAMLASPKTEGYEPIGTFGMHLSSGNPSGDDQIGRLRKIRDEHGVNNLIFLWDGERKAILAAIDQALIAASYGFHTKIAFLPDGKDPADCYLHVIQEAVLNAKTCKTALDALRLKRDAGRYRTA